MWKYRKCWTLFSNRSWETQCLCIKMGMTAHSALKWIEFPSHSAVAEIHLISAWYKAIFFFSSHQNDFLGICMCALTPSPSLPSSGRVFVYAHIHTPLLTFRVLRNIAVDFTHTDVQIYSLGSIHLWCSVPRISVQNDFEAWQIVWTLKTF